MTKNKNKLFIKYERKKHNSSSFIYINLLINYKW